MNIAFADTEINNFRQNRIIQLAWQVVNLETMKTTVRASSLILPNGWVIPDQKFWIENGFSTRKNYREGHPIDQVLRAFINDLLNCQLLVSHNMTFDMRMLMGEMQRLSMLFPKIDYLCTMTISKDYCKMPLKTKGGYKAPRLSELYKFLFEEEMLNCHDAGGDVEACKRCFFELVKRGVIKLPVTV